MNKIFEYPIVISGSDLDVFGHVNNAVYLEYFEKARWDFIEKGGYGLELIQKMQKGPVILEMNLRFKKELRNRDSIVILSKYKEMKNSLVMILYQEMRKDNGDLAASLELSVGLMDLVKRKLIKPTCEWFEAIGAAQD